MCNVLDIRRQAYYKWLNRGKPIANNFNREHAIIISEEHIRLERKYGVERLSKEIGQSRGIIMNHKKVRRYLRLLGLSCIARVRKLHKHKEEQKKKSHMNMAPNLLNSNFTSSASGKKLSTDVSYIECTDGWLYLSAVKDLFNNQIIAHYTSDRNNLELAIKTINQLNKGNGIIHSDQGSLYYSREYIEHIEYIEHTVLVSIFVIPFYLSLFI